MTRSSRQQIQRTERRARIADLVLQGYSQTWIAQELRISQSVVSKDLKQIAKQWRESAIRDFDLARATELQKLNKLELEAWQAWQRSQEPSQTAVLEGPSSQGATGDKARKTIQNQYGDARFLDIVHKCILQRRALLGLDMTPEPETQQHVDIDPDLQRTRLVAVLTNLQPPRAMADMAAGSGSLQSGMSGDGCLPGKVESRQTPGSTGPGDCGSTGTG